MCGIFAYLNYNVDRDRRYMLELLFNCLRRLEYRGYDSAGISIDSDSVSSADLGRNFPTNSQTPLVFRQQGKIDQLVRSVYEEVDETNLNLDQTFSVHTGIAHTRWATHGMPSPRNTHPQSSGKGNEFLVVHNGIVTNYMELKKTLVRHGFNFESDTDTEVIPKLAKFVFDRLSEEDDFLCDQPTFSQVVLEVMRKVEGVYALVFKSPHYPNELVACKLGSPLLPGLKELNENPHGGTPFNDVNFLAQTDNPREVFLSSDANALIEHTEQVLVIEDGEVVHIKDNAAGGLPRPASARRALSILEMVVEQMKKGNYEHYMQKEIHEQRGSLKATMGGRLICMHKPKAN